MTGHFGIPGPGGSLGECAVCGESFAGETLKSLFGFGPDGIGIQQFKVAAIDQMLYAHAPRCVEALKAAIDPASNELVPERLPATGKLRPALVEILAQRARIEQEETS